ncbi:hypothetical protein [Paenisporosarcina sp.]|uniref:hypothetical protein n=1 Tax=Paenisporosarcina sp. TaxID=1932001 RepID=UPI003C779FBF
MKLKLLVLTILLCLIMLDTRYEGNEVAAVSFHDKDNVVVGTPLILVDLETNEVVGYMPSE